jgi:hypothetical protein
MGHLDQVRQGTCSTQPQTPTRTNIPTMPNFHIDNHMAEAPQAPLNAHTNLIFMQIHAIEGVISSDQTGRFPITSNRGNAYVIVFYVYDANYIRSISIRNRSKEELLRAYNEVYKWLLVRGFKPLLQKMDNEISHDVKKFIQAQQTRLQYTPPDMHRTNPAVRAIRTWKNHFIAGIAGLPKTFPIANWCRLTKQCNTTLNMLRPCRRNPLLSAHEALKGSFSFDATPMAPLGTEVLIHMKPNRHSTWGYHASKAWYLSHSPNHYRCIRVLMADTGGNASLTPSGTIIMPSRSPKSQPPTGSSKPLHASLRRSKEYRNPRLTSLLQSKPYERSSLAKYPLSHQHLHQSRHHAPLLTRNLW